MYQKLGNRVECWTILIILFLALSQVASYYIKSPVVHQPEATRQPHVTQAHDVDRSANLYRPPPYRVTSYAAPLIPSAPANYGPIVGITSPVKTTTPYQTTWTPENEDYSEVSSETIKSTNEESTTVQYDVSTVEYEVEEKETETEEPETTTYWILDTTNIGASSYEGTTASFHDTPRDIAISTQFR